MDMSSCSCCPWINIWARSIANFPLTTTVFGEGAACGDAADEGVATAMSLPGVGIECPKGDAWSKARMCDRRIAAYGMFHFKKLLINQHPDTHITLCNLHAVRKWQHRSSNDTLSIRFVLQDHILASIARLRLHISSHLVLLDWSSVKGNNGTWFARKSSTL